MIIPHLQGVFVNNLLILVNWCDFPHEMICYSKVCEILTDAVPLTPDFCPLFRIKQSNEIPAGGISDSYGIKKKVQQGYDKWVGYSRHSISSKLVSRGYCKIDNFTGNELLRILCSIISEKIEDGSSAYEPGNVLYFLKNRNICAAIRFTNSKPIITTSSQTQFEKDADVT